MFSNIGKQPKSSSVGPRQSNKLCLFRPGCYCTILDDAHLPKSAGDKLKEFQTNWERGDIRGESDWVGFSFPVHFKKLFLTLLSSFICSIPWELLQCLQRKATNRPLLFAYFMLHLSPCRKFVFLWFLLECLLLCSLLCRLWNSLFIFSEDHLRVEGQGDLICTLRAHLECFAHLDVFSDQRICI